MTCQLTAPLGIIAPAIPETVVVSVVLPPKIGLADATSEIVGSCLAMVIVCGVAV